VKYNMTIDEIPDLPGYLSVAQVVERYGINKQTVYYMIFSQRAFKRVFKISRGSDAKRVVLMLNEAEVASVMQQREERGHRPPSRKAALRDWTYRVKQWGWDNKWTATPIAKSGPPTRQLVDAYLQAHPDDPRP
jgi:hypothetical protein